MNQITRKDFLKLGFASLSVWRTRSMLAEPAQRVSPSCVLTPEQTEGPFFVDEHLNRSDIRVDPTTGASSAGVPMKLTLRVLRVSSECAPLAGAIVDIWHCDATGVYSDVNNLGAGP